MSRYCAYQDRTQQQVRDKLYDLGLRSDVVEEVIAALVTDGFINEERYAKSFAGGKFRIKKWGRLKIEHQLRLKGLTDYCVQAGMKEIEDDDYLLTLEELATKKFNSLNGTDAVRKEKTKRFLANKGYEYDLINKTLNQLS